MAGVKCPICGRRGSERHASSIEWQDRIECGENIVETCPDPIHDLADEAPALKAEVEHLEAEAAKWEESSRFNYANYLQAAERSDARRLQHDAARAELEEAVALLRDLKSFFDDHMGWEGMIAESKRKPDCAWTQHDAYRLGKVDAFLASHAKEPRDDS